MSKKSILGLEKTLYDLKYNPDHIRIFVNAIDQILQKGSTKIEDQTISAAGVHSLFKINPKSVDVYLITSEERDCLRIHHPKNSWWNKNNSQKASYFGCRKWFATSAWDPRQETWRKKCLIF